MQWKTQRTSWKDRAVSSKTSFLLPRTMTNTVLPTYWISVICQIITTSPKKYGSLRLMYYLTNPKREYRFVFMPSGNFVINVDIFYYSGKLMKEFVKKDRIRSNVYIIGGVKDLICLTLWCHYNILGNNVVMWVNLFLK